MNKENQRISRTYNIHPRRHGQRGAQLHRPAGQLFMVHLRQGARGLAKKTDGKKHYQHAVQGDEGGHHGFNGGDKRHRRRKRYGPLGRQCSQKRNALYDHKYGRVFF